MKRYAINNGNELIRGKVRYINLADISGKPNIKNLAIDEYGNLGTSEGGSTSVAWQDITGKPSVYTPEIGTTATTAKAGNYVPTWAEITSKPTTFAPIIGSTATTAMAGNTVIPAVATVAPLAPGTAAVGTSLLYARQDHVHPVQTSISGNAGTATALATGRTFSLTGGATGTSAAFTGAANASIPVTLATPTASVRGGVLLQAAQTDSVAADTAELVTDFNSLLAKLRAAGIITA